MSRRHRLSSVGNQDVASIIEYLAKRNLDAALNLVDRLTETFELISAQPEIGQRYSDPRRQLRRTSHGNYVIVYQVLPDEVVIVRVVHGARDWQELLKPLGPDVVE